MRQKALQGIYPGHPGFGYRVNRTLRCIEPHPDKKLPAKRIFELYATGNHSGLSVSKEIDREFGIKLSTSRVGLILRDPIYIGAFRFFHGELFNGTHEHIITKQLFDEVQHLLDGHKKNNLQKREIAFFSLVQCHHDSCMITGEIKKEKYVYYHGTGFHGKCDTPRFTEADLARILGTVLQNIQIPSEIVQQICASLEKEHQRIDDESATRRKRLDERLKAIQNRMDNAFEAKLDGSVPSDVCERKISQLKADEDHLKLEIAGFQPFQPTRLLDAKKTLELANKAYLLYIKRKPAEQAELLRLVLSNCSIDEVSLYPT